MFLDTFIQKVVFKIMKIINFRGELIDTSAKKEALTVGDQVVRVIEGFNSALIQRILWENLKLFVARTIRYILDLSVLGVQQPFVIWKGLLHRGSLFRKFPVPVSIDFVFKIK